MKNSVFSWVNGKWRENNFLMEINLKHAMKFFKTQINGHENFSRKFFCPQDFWHKFGVLDKVYIVWRKTNTSSDCWLSSSLSVFVFQDTSFVIAIIFKIKKIYFNTS